MSIPRVLNGRYEMGELLGRGGMADVYKATDTRLGRIVAIKLLRGEVARDSQLQARFRREAQAVAGLNHPSIVAVYDTGEHVSGDPLRDGAALPYIVMEYVHGKTLRDLVRADAISIDQGIEFSLGVLSALEYSHRAGIVHRDIKPANVMVTDSSEGHLGSVKVMDFGIARTISDSAATMTQTQTVMGTAQYLSPEQARGESVDARSDLYSAACLLYEMLAGRPPFTGDSPVSVAYQHVREVPPTPSTFNAKISPAVDSVILRALQKNRQDRFQDASSFRRALRAARTGVVLDASPKPAPAALVTEAIAPEVPVTVSNSAAATDPSGDGPSTRAIAKVLAGGALITDDGATEVPDEPELPEKRKRRAWIITLSVFLAIVLAGGGLLAYNLMTAKPPAAIQLTVPDVSGMSEAAAMTKLSSMDFDPASTTEYSNKVAVGEVISTDPVAGSLVEANTNISVLVSKGSSEVVIPKDLVGRTEAEVRADLGALNLKLSPNEQVNDPQIQSGLVVSSDPLPGETVEVGTEVTLKISTGQVLMPSLFDLTDDPTAVRDAVKAALTKASPFLQVEFVETENSVVTPGMVTGQSQPAGTSVPQRTTITVTLAKAPPTPTPTPSPSASPEPTSTSSASNPPTPN